MARATTTMADAWISAARGAPFGFGNITNDPVFVSWSARDFTLQTNSPCIDTGNNVYAAGNTDLQGKPRIAGRQVDIGAYEDHTPDLLFRAWLQSYNLPAEASFSDADSDGHNNWQEWRCHTDPTNALSAFRLFSICATSSNLVLSWQSAAGMRYFLERSSDGPQPTSFRLIATNISASGPITVVTSAIPTTASPLLFRVGLAE